MDLSLLPLAFSLILTVASRLLHPYSTDDKTSRLMVKRFSTVGDTQRGTQYYMKKRRGRREIEVTRRRRGGYKRGERNLASNQFLFALHSLEHSERFMEFHREEKREEGDRGDQEEGRGESKGERPVYPVISSLSVLHSLEHTKRFTELSREEKREGGDKR